MTPNSQASASDTPEVVSKRTFPAPPAEVFDAFLDAERLKRWWGPEGFTNRFERFETWAGGRWTLEMQSPDGSVFRLEKSFVVVDPPRLVVLDHLDPVHGFRMHMAFDPVDDGRTSLTWTVTFASEEESIRVGDAFLQANEQNFDRLEAELRRS